MKKRLSKRNEIIIGGIIFGGILAGLIWSLKQQAPAATPVPTPIPSPAPTVIPSPSPSPTPRPLTFAETNTLYGPCAVVPTLMYHHIQPEDVAKTKNQTSLTVTPDAFQKHLDYLAAKGYTAITPGALISFFQNNEALPKKSVMLTFDDGYADFFEYAFPILKSHAMHATLFVPTGLMENPDYLTWNHVKEMADSGLIYIGNHTWSHHSTATNKDTVAKEVGTAMTQLSERSLDPLKVFAYPYGSDSAVAETYLTENGFKLAFSTKPGTTLCAKKNLSLPRIRVGNSVLSAYGL